MDKIKNKIKEFMNKHGKVVAITVAIMALLIFISSI
jgi:hypothetical protein